MINFIIYYYLRQGRVLLPSAVAAIGALACWSALLPVVITRTIFLLAAVASAPAYSRLSESHALINISLLHGLVIVAVVATADASATLRVAVTAHLEALAVSLGAPIASAATAHDLFLSCG